MPLLEVQSLVKAFRGKIAVNGVSLTVEAGEIVGLLGKNGAGKSTTFKMIMGTLTPDRGTVLFDGHDVSKWPMHRRCLAGLGYLAQVPTIFRGLTVEKNILAVLEHLCLSRKQRRKRCEKLLHDYHLTKIRDNPSFRCSGGEKRRLELARALATEPKLILLDEPFAGVDPKHVGDIVSLIHGVRDQGIAVLITDHNAAQTLRAIQKAAIMIDQKVAKTGTPEDVVNDQNCRNDYFGHDFVYDPRLMAAAARDNSSRPLEVH